MVSRTRLNKNNAQRIQKKVCQVIKQYFTEFKVLSPVDDAFYEGGPYIKPKAMGLPGEDIFLSFLAREKCPLSIEVKHGKGYQKVVDAYEQAENNKPSLPGIHSVAVIHPTRSNILLAVLDFNDLLSLVSEAYYDKTSKE